MIHTAENTHWVFYTDRTNNPEIREFITESDLESAIQAAKALGSRPDPFVADIVAALLEQSSNRTASQSGFILRILLSSVFPSGMDKQLLQKRLLENKESLDLLAANLSRFTPQLKAEVLRLLRSPALESYDAILLEQGKELSDLLKSQNGFADAEQTALIETFLESVTSRKDPDFLDPVLRILERTRQKSIAEKAKLAALSLAVLK